MGYVVVVKSARLELVVVVVALLVVEDVELVLLGPVAVVVVQGLPVLTGLAPVGYVVLGAWCHRRSRCCLLVLVELVVVAVVDDQLRLLVIVVLRPGREFPLLHLRSLVRLLVRYLVEQGQKSSGAKSCVVLGC